MSPRRALFAFGLCSLLAAAPAAAQRRGRPVRRGAPAAPTLPAAPSPTSAVESPGFALRPIDRATVRVIAIRGLVGRFGRGRSGALRLIAAGATAYGSGVVVSADGAVLTARHVVEGADLLAVVFPGQRVAVPAAVAYSDPAHDVAFMRVRTGAPIVDFVTLPAETPTLTSGQRILVSGYPLDPEERYPAAAAGEFSRINNDGRIQLSISVNHGNSGGPVLDESGRLIGVVSQRGEPGQGVEGLSLVEPIRNAVEPWRREGASLPPPSFSDDDARVAQAAYDFLRLDIDRDVRDPGSADRALALGAAQLRPEAAALVGAQAWNEALLLLETRNATTVASLAPEVRPRAEALLRVATDLQLRALREAPYLRTNYPFLYWFSRIRGNVVAPPPSPTRANENEAGERLVEAGEGAEAPAANTPASTAAAKLTDFLARRLQVRTSPAATARAAATLTIRISASGMLQAGRVQEGTGDPACDGEVAAQLRALVERHPRIESLSASEVAAIADQDLQVTLRLRQ